MRVWSLANDSCTTRAQALVAWVLVLLTMVVPSAHAASPLSVVVVPEDLHLSIARSGEILVTITNEGGSVVSEVEVELATRDAFVLEPAPDEDAPAQPNLVLAPGQQVSRRLWLRRVPGAGLAPRAFLRVRAVGPEGEAIDAMPASASLTVVDPPVTDASTGWSVRLEGPTDVVLEQGKPQLVYLVVDNHLSVPLRLRRVEVCKRPVEDRIETSSSGEPLDLCDSVVASYHSPPQAEIPAGQSEVVALRLEAGARLQQGKGVLVYDVLGEVDGHETRVSVTQGVELGIPGQSELLALIGVPLFVAVPGFLVLMAFSMAYQWVEGGKPPERLQPTKPDFWVLAVFLSIIAVPAFTAVRGYSYVDGYGLGDVACVWLLFTLLGVAAWGAWRLFRFTLAWYRELETLTTKLEPLEVFERLARRRTTFPLRCVSYGGKSYFLAIGKLTDDDDATVWLIPPINYTRPTDESREKEIVEIMEMLELKEQELREVPRPLTRAALEWDGDHPIEVKRGQVKPAKGTLFEPRDPERHESPMSPNGWARE